MTAPPAHPDAAQPPSSQAAKDEHDRLFLLCLDMLCVAGFDGFFKRLNPAWRKTLGWTEAELMARPYVEFVHPDDRAATASEAGRLVGGGYVTVSFENRYRCADGSYKWLLWNASPLASQGLIYAAARDITDRKAAEDEAARTLRQVRELAAELEKAVASERDAHGQLKKAQSQLVQTEKLTALGQMVAGVAHEINNPLAYLVNNAAVLQRDVAALREIVCIYQEADAVLARHAPETAARALALAARIDLPYTLANLDRLVDRSREGLRRIQQIVRDLRDFARLDQWDIRNADVNAGIRSTLNIVGGRALKKNVEIEADLGELPAFVCNLSKINQVVLNLVANAIDASPERGRVKVRTCRSGGEIQIHISDNGPGIDPAVRDKIFDPFFTTKPLGKGTGLGLSISHGIVEEHGGRIEVDSEPERGAHFVVHLPVAPQIRGRDS